MKKNWFKSKLSTRILAVAVLAMFLIVSVPQTIYAGEGPEEAVSSQVDANLENEILPDETDPVDESETTDPAEATDPVDATDPADPVPSVDPAGPAGPAGAVDAPVAALEEDAPVAVLEADAPQAGTEAEEDAPQAGLEADPPQVEYEIKIEYLYQDDRTMAVSPYVVKVAQGADYLLEVESPAVAGYVPDPLKVSQQFTAVAKNEVVTVLYAPALGISTDPTLKPIRRVEIRYVFEDGSQAASSWMGDVQDGAVPGLTIDAPAVAGYTPEPASTALNTAITKNEVYYVVYKAQAAPYRLRLTQQDPDDMDVYTEFDVLDMTGTVGQVPDPATWALPTIEGYSPAYDASALPAVAPAVYDAGGTLLSCTEIIIPYARNAYEIIFTDTETGFEQRMSYLYGQALPVDGIDLPALYNKTGVAPTGWSISTPDGGFTVDMTEGKLAGNATMPHIEGGMLTLEATWGDAVVYTVEYWVEDPNTGAYTFIGFEKRTGTAGEDIAGLVPAVGSTDAADFTSEAIFPIADYVEAKGGARRPFVYTDPADIATKNPGSAFYTYSGYDPANVGPGDTLNADGTTVLKYHFAANAFQLEYSGNGVTFTSPHGVDATSYTTRPIKFGERLGTEDWFEITEGGANNTRFGGWLRASADYRRYYLGQPTA
ncbi:MAG: hypothetical protein AB7V55_06940, partial [Oscillospiraceae bacterium]